MGSLISIYLTNGTHRRFVLPGLPAFHRARRYIEFQYPVDLMQRNFASHCDIVRLVHLDAVSPADL